MRGSPLLRALTAFLVLLLLGWPLWSLTHEPEAAPSVVPAASEAAPLKPVGLRLTFTTAPREIKILHLGKVIWKQAAPAQEAEAALQVPYPESGIDLQFEIAWPGETFAAMRVRLTDPAGDAHEKTLSGTGVVADVLTFP